MNGRECFLDKKGEGNKQRVRGEEGGGLTYQNSNAYEYIGKK